MKAHGGVVWRAYSLSVKSTVPLFLCILGCLQTLPLTAAQKDEVTEPTLSSLFPLGGQKGTTLEVEFRGKLLGEVYAVWVRSHALQARIKAVEEIKKDSSEVMETDASGKEKSNSPDYRVLVQIDIDSSAQVGLHPLRLVSRPGVTNALHFRVVDQPVIVEATTPDHPALELSFARRPVIIQGRLAEPGAGDLYSFHALEGQNLSFEVLRANGFEVRLALYGSKGSWLDPERTTRILFDEERSSDLVRLRSKGTHQVAQTGRYTVEISSLFEKGHPDFSYELEVFAGDQAPEARSDQRITPPEQQQRYRTFDRKVGDGWLTFLQERAPERSEDSQAGSSGAGSSEASNTIQPTANEAIDQAEALPRPLLLRESEPNDLEEKALSVSVPGVIQGAIGLPGDIDVYQFEVEAGQKLAFEIETPEAGPPHFNPRIGVVDSQNHELFTNIHRRASLYNNNAKAHHYFESVEPKVIYSFDSAGRYFLHVRDITSRYGGPSYAYRVLVRPQIPHVGEVALEQVDRLNLVPGRTRKLTIVTSHEEGFTGDVSFSFEGLPTGVEVLPAAEVNNDRAPTDIPVKPELILPKTQETTIILLATDAASLTRMPLLIQVHCQLIVNGKPGSNLLIREIPLMVVEEAERVDEKT